MQNILTQFLYFPKHLSLTEGYESQNFNSNACKRKEDSKDCDNYTMQKVQWHEFDWKTYIKKDLIETDIDFPTDRFGINLPKSIEIGVNRTLPDNR